MRAARLLVLAVFCAMAMVGASLLQSPGVPLSVPEFIEPLRADPQPVDVSSGVPVSPDPAHPDAGKHHTLPDFVPRNGLLTNSSSDESGPQGEEPGSAPQAQSPTPADTATTTGSVTTGHQAGAKPAADSSTARPVAIKVEPIPGTQPADASKKPVWPKFIGAKTLFGAAKAPAPLEARAIGSYSRGCLSGAVPLPIDGPAWQEMRLSRNRNWGHPKLIELVQQFAKDAQKLDGWPGLLVGDIAQPRGGPMITGHASHQIGLDADIWLTPMPDRRLTTKEREELQATSMLDKTGLAVDPAVFSEKQVALIKRAASYPEVERIFVHPAIKKALCKAADATDRKWLGKVRPWFGHYYHFHMRIKCPEGFAGCAPQPPPTGDDGCGKEVDQWLAKVIPSKVPLEPVPAPADGTKPPKPPMMLAELPKECQAVLASGPDPVPVPREALLTPIQVKKTLAKAAAVHSALASAAAVPGAGVSASTARTLPAHLANSPALRPHLQKAATPDPKPADPK
ncbi:penicillin-insensitive murein endopeptidase [Hyphomicrobium sp.]|uniref:penicillin-insensitive murein endopeptidase n=1 Tax=Hyphomicrobium sp. TaxID=82 RepID=UPI000F9D1359|nr:penicillin-insensitive murein endopeptidase [Hyphomicrobium sp.]RUP09546.1 MAG: penicillin-insensitive murein endopeptidase [Hyphomicrobium sp.]